MVSPSALSFGSRTVPWNEMVKTSATAEHSAVSRVSACSAFVADNHWSSTENNSNNGWNFNFNNGNQNNNNKTNNNRVRAFRK